MNKNLFLSMLLLVLVAHSLQAQRLADNVDTRVGTAVAITKTAGVFGQGTEEFAHTLPAVLVPYGMNFWTPETQATERKGVCPYLYKDTALRGFRCSHWIVGGCTQDYGSFTISPIHTAESVAYDHNDEVARPYYYAATMGDVRAEMTATERCGMLRFTFANADSAYVRVRVNSDFDEGDVWLDTLRGCVYAKNPCHRIYQGKGKPTGTTSWLCMYYDQPIAEYGKLDNQTLWLRFRPTATVTVKAACSFTGSDGARRNLDAEMPAWDFDTYKAALADIWEKKLGQITLKPLPSYPSPLEHQPSVFYTALYHTSFLPHMINDVDGSYPKFSDGAVLKDDSMRDDGVMMSPQGYYDDYSMWDTYRAQHPLLTLLEPQRDGEMMQSLVRKYEQGGWMPIFPCWNSYTAAMIGDHCTAAIADAYVKGIRNFDAIKAYEGMRRNAFESPQTYAEYCDGMGRRALQSYLQHGYIPLEDSVREAYHQHEQTSRTLEYAYDDFALAQMARALANDGTITDADLARCGLSKKMLMNDYHELIRRSANWRNVVNEATGWAGGRHADGSFASVADIAYIKEPEKHPDAHSLTPTTFSTFITEGTPVHYSWYVPHDVEGLAAAMGGTSAMEARLDSMFQRGWYWHGNEPCHQVAYLYSAIGKHNKTVDAVRNIMQTEYLNAPGGLSGNDDAGQMSAWYVFSALGFYPVCPSTPYYYLGAPSFPEMTIRLANDRTFAVRASGLAEGLQHVRAVRLNGKRIRQPYISHDNIMAGGLLEFEME